MTETGPATDTRKRKHRRANLGTIPPSLFGFILHHTGKAQGLLILVSTAVQPFVYYSLDLPKHIVNTAIQDRAGKTLFGHLFEPVNYLILLSLVFLALVLGIGALKYFINVYTGRLTAKANLILRVILSHAERRLSGAIDGARRIAVVTKEIEFIGSFAGDALVTPIFQGCTLLTTMIFIIVQEPVFGTLIILLSSVRGAIVPFIQRPLNRRFAEYTLGVRDVAAAVTDDADATSRRQPFSTYYHLLRSVFYLEYRQARLIAFMSFVNGLNNQAISFLLFLGGGMLVFDSRLTFGTLVAMLVASKDIHAPMSELVSYYRRLCLARVGYDLIRSNMNTGMSPSLAEITEVPLLRMSLSPLPG